MDQKQRSLASRKPRALCVAGAIACAAFAVLFGALITKSVLSVLEGFGGMVGSELPTTVRMGIGAVVGGILCALGFNTGKANDAKDLARRVLVVVVVLAVSFVAGEVVFALTVMACRMILSAHFLSDVSVGALISVMAFFVMMALQNRSSGSPQPDSDEGIPAC